MIQPDFATIKNKLFLTFILFLGTSSHIICRQNNDSLKKILAQKVPDTTIYNTAVDLAWNYMYTNSDTAIFYAETALHKAKQIHDDLKTANADNTLGVCYIVLGNYYEALRYLNNAQQLSEKLVAYDSNNYSYNRRLMAIYTNKGNVYYFKSKFELAVKNYLKALKLAQKIQYQNGISVTISNIGASYLDMLDYEKALEYNYKALAIAKKNNVKNAVTQALNNLGSTYYSMKQYDSAYNYFNRCTKMNETGKYKHELITNYVNMGDVLRSLKNYDSAYFFYQKSINLGKKLKSTNGLINSYYMLGQYFKETKQYDSAIKYYTKSVGLADKNGSLRFNMLNNEELADVYQLKNNYKKAFDHYVKSRNAADSIFNNEKTKIIADMETKYQSQEKENKITFLNEKNLWLKKNVSKTRIVMGALLIILILIIISILLSYRSYKLKQLAERHKLQRETEKRLLQTVLETEIKERKRFADDLHDGLGALLSTLRLYLNEINNVGNDKREEIIKAGSKMLDEAIRNARNISNNIMPVILKNNGLIAAIRTFVDKINASGKININIKTIGFNKKLPSIVEANLYFVLIEMINNTLKHANASQIDITFTNKNNQLFISYSDNGSGFNYKKALQSSQKGKGLNNIISRVQSLNGTLDIKTRDGYGFFMGIKLDIPASNPS